MNQLKTITIGITVSLTLLIGCATPQAVLDHANNGVSMTVSLQEALRDFRRVQSSISKGRIDSIRRQQSLLDTYESDFAYDSRVMQASSKTDELKLFNQLKELSDSRAKDAKDLQARLDMIDVQMTKLVAPLPDGTQALKDTQKALAALGTQLTSMERVDLGVTFAKSFKKTLDENKIKADAAVEKSPAPIPMQTFHTKP